MRLAPVALCSLSAFLRTRPSSCVRRGSSSSSSIGTIAVMSAATDQDSTPLVSNRPAPSCVPCSSLDKSHLLSEEEIQRRVRESLQLWSVGEETNGVSSYLYRRFTAKNFQAALDAINAFGAVAEAESHHPNFHLTNYREVLVEIWTHKVGGVTENDLTLAQKMDAQVQIEYSPKWLKGHPQAASTAKSEPSTFDV